MKRIQNMNSVDEFQFIVDRLADTILVRPETNNTKNDDSSISSSPGSDDFGALGLEEVEEIDYPDLDPQPIRKKYCRLENRLLELLLPEYLDEERDNDRKPKKRCVPIFLDEPAPVDDNLLEEANDQEEFFDWPFLSCLLWPRTLYIWK